MVQLKTLRLALSELSSAQLRRLLMHAVAQLPVREIARREGCSERAVKYSLARARRKMKEILPEGSPPERPLSVWMRGRSPHGP